MGRTIFTDKDAVVGKDKMAANAHQCGHTDSRTHEISKDKEGRAKKAGARRGGSAH